MRKRILFMTTNAMLVAIIVIMGFFPQIGFIQIIPALPAFTLIHIPVLVGSFFTGWRGGIFYGLVFGFVSFLQATLNPGPLNAIFLNIGISIAPRLLFGLASGFAFDFLRLMKTNWVKQLILIPTAFLLTLFHTVVVLSAIVLFEGSNFLDPISFESIWFFIQPILLTNGFGEAILASILFPLIVIPLNRFRNYNKQRGNL